MRLMSAQLGHNTGLGKFLLQGILSGLSPDL
jgi:hypothetical protein